MPKLKEMAADILDVLGVPSGGKNISSTPEQPTDITEAVTAVSERITKTVDEVRQEKGHGTTAFEAMPGSLMA